MKLAKFMALMLATGTALCAASCSDDDDDDDNNVAVADAVCGSYVQDLVYSMVYSSDTLTNDTLTITKVSNDMVNLHFSQYVGMGSGTSQLNVYNVKVSQGSNGSYSLAVSSDTTQATKAQMTGSKYDVTALTGTIDTKSATVDFDFLISKMNATFSNKFDNATKITK